MIIEIDNIYFNPLTITSMHQEGFHVRIWFDNKNSLLVTSWLVADLASKINELIKEFNNDGTSQS